MQELASAHDMRQYCTRFLSIFRRALRPGVNSDILAIVSTAEGALVLFTFSKKKQGAFKFKSIRKPIAFAVQGLSLRGFAGDLSKARFLGKNVAAEGNKLVIIKGDNTRTSWSSEIAVRDAIEEVRRTAEP